MVFEIFRRTIEAHGLVTPGDRVLAAVSGGSDSVAMLLLLARHAAGVPATLIVAHVNHRMRPGTADRDEEFTRQLAASLDLEAVVLTPDMLGLAAPPRGEEAARLVRLRLLSRAARRNDCSRIALGHTLDDQAETILMRLMRGAGRRGIAGMSYAGPGRVIRPMLDIRRGEARRWLEQRGQPFCEDETNLDLRILRNRIRGQLLPVMEGINPAVVKTIGRAATLLAEEDRYLEDLAASWLASRTQPGQGVPADELAAAPAPLGRRVARAMIRAAGGDPRGAPLADVAAVLELAGRREGGTRLLRRGIVAERRDGRLVVRGGGPAARGPAVSFQLSLAVPGSVTLDDGSLIEATLSEDPADRGADRAGARRALLDADRLGSGVVVRNRRPGDTFHPLGAPGRRKLKRLLIDLKIPRSERDAIPLVVSGEGIAWVVGHRIGHPYRITPATRRVAVLEHKRRVDSG